MTLSVFKFLVKVNITSDYCVAVYFPNDVAQLCCQIK